MAITATAYPTLGLHMAKGEVNLDTATCKVTLHASTYTPNKDHSYFSDVTNEVTGTGYTAGGVTLTGKVLAYDASTDRTYLDFADPSWAALTATYRYAVWRVDTGSSATSPLICWTDFGVDQVATGSTETLAIDPTGLLRIA